MKIQADIDIDVSDREKVLENLMHTRASRIHNDNLKPHNVGIYFQNIPKDPLTGISTIPYKEAEERGYFKVDILNVHAYGLGKVKSEEHLYELINKEPIWEMLEYEEVTKTIFQLKNEQTHDVLVKFKPRSITDLAICAALIRPGKVYLINEDWTTIEEEIWKPIEEEDGKYYWRKSHAIGYAIAIVVQMNLMTED